ncbi:hypothetical protein PHMEG_00017614, partial [Phytophthora megakarya]
GGTIDSHELDTLPRGHFYTVQEAGWLDANSWAFYVENILKFEIDLPALLLAYNFNCHVSEEGVRVVAEEACATVVPLPPYYCGPITTKKYFGLSTTRRGG